MSSSERSNSRRRSRRSAAARPSAQAGPHRSAGRPSRRRAARASPGPIAPTTSPSTVTLGAGVTRCTTARIAHSLPLAGLSVRLIDESAVTSTRERSLPIGRTMEASGSPEPVARTRDAARARRRRDRRSSSSSRWREAADRISGSARSWSRRATLARAPSRACSPSNTSSSSSSSTSRRSSIEAAMLLPENLARRYRACRSASSTTAPCSSPSPTRRTSCSPTSFGSPSACRCASASRLPRAIELAITTVHDAADGLDRGGRHDAEETEDDATVLDLDHDTPRSSSSTGRSRRRWSSAPRTSTSPRSSDGSSSASASTASCAS